MAAEKLPPDLSALISLLDDPDTEAFRQVSKQISALGPKAVAPLEAAWEQAFDPVMQKRIEELVHQIQFDQLYNDFTAWATESEHDLFSGYLLVSRYQYPDLSELKIKSQFDLIVRDTWLELNDNLTALEKIKVLNHLLFLVYKFVGSATITPTPENYFLNILLESRMGTSLSIGILYLIIAQRLGIPLKGVDLPHNFIVAFTNQVEEAGISGLDLLEVKFYINPISQGSVFNLKDLNQYLKNIELEPQEKYYLPCSNVQIIYRLIEEIKVAYRLLGSHEKEEELSMLQDVIKFNKT